MGCSLLISTSRIDFSTSTSLKPNIPNDTYQYIYPTKLDLSRRSEFITGASGAVGRAAALSYAAVGCSKIAIGARSDLLPFESEIKEAARKEGRYQAPKAMITKLDVTSENSVKGVFLCSNYFIPVLLKSDLKTNIITSSSTPGASAYQSSKFAGCRMAEFIDADYGDKGLVCFAIHPGGIKTDLALGAKHQPWLSGRFISIQWDMEELEAKMDDIVKGVLLQFRMTTKV
ncbi:hypothetical protein F4779DRAFT_625111 [Xylariaceae sp. FL0662B]|nr:hypothetical protein F4779DRAFT_625111 [Xylariaceae sp. FL0662B]